MITIFDLISRIKNKVKIPSAVEYKRVRYYYKEDDCEYYSSVDGQPLLKTLLSTSNIQDTLSQEVQIVDVENCHIMDIDEAIGKLQRIVDSNSLILNYVDINCYIYSQDVRAIYTVLEYIKHIEDNKEMN